MKKITILLICLAAALNFYPGCTKAIKSGDNPPDGGVEVTPDNAIDETYLKEGFISSDTFRVVLVECDTYDSIPLESVKDKARKRALATLQKYLVNNSRIVDNNTNAELLILIDAGGEFSKQNFKTDNNSVYYFEIKKKNIKKQVDTIADKR